MRALRLPACLLVFLVGICSAAPAPARAAAAPARAAAAPARAAAAGTDATWFLKRTQALYDAVASGHKAIWRRTLSDDCIITDEDGHVYDRSAFLDTLSGLPKGFSGAIKIRHLTARTFGPAAAVHYWIDEHEDVLGQRLHTLYVETDTYRYERGAWKMIAAQVTVVPRDLKPVAVDKRGWPELAGAYRLGAAPGRLYHVYLRAGSLYWGSDEKSAKLLIPLSPLVFFVQRSIHTVVFVRGARGQITAALELHKYNEIVMRRTGVADDAKRMSAPATGRAASAAGSATAEAPHRRRPARRP